MVVPKYVGAMTVCDAAVWTALSGNSEGSDVLLARSPQDVVELTGPSVTGGVVAASAFVLAAFAARRARAFSGGG
jgi:ABC-type Fe2+-enterobactin transport system substrate-binding protein